MKRHFITYKLAKEFYMAAKALNIRGTLRHHLLDAASSVVLNLAEGSGRARAGDRRRFYQIAMGSLRECQAVLDLIPSAAGGELFELSDTLGAHLYKLICNVKGLR